MYMRRTIGLRCHITFFCAQACRVEKALGWLCVDLSKLNDSVLRERLMLPSVDQVLAQLADAKVLSKLDCKNAFTQILL